MEYLIKVSTVISIFYICYKLFLQRDTFFESNRWFLLFGLITAFTIPYFVIPVYIEITAVTLPEYPYGEITSNQNLQSKSFDWLNILLATYLFGVLFFSCRFAIQINSLLNIIFKKKGEKSGNYTFIKTEGRVSPFSFFNWIVYNPSDYSQAEIDLIIAHEKVHARQYHSLDVLITQLCCIILWFNPFMWLYNNDIKQNLEFIADKNTQQKSPCKKSYQYTLLKTSLPTNQLVLSNNFYNSLIKKRIVMLQKSKSKEIHRIKYTLVIPLLALFLMSFNTKTIFIEKENPFPIANNNQFIFDDSTALKNSDRNEDILIKNEDSEQINVLKEKTKNGVSVNSNIKKERDIYQFIINKNSTDADLNKLASKVKAKGVTLKIKSIKRNSKNEIITIKIEANGKNSNASFNLNSEDPITPIKISFEDEGKNLSIGNTSSKHKIHKSGKGNNVFIISDDDDHEIHEIQVDSSNNYTIPSTKGKHKKIEIIHDDEDIELIEVIVDDDKESKEDIIILKNKATFGNSDGKSFKVKTISKGKSNSKIIIKSDDKSEPIFFVDGKESKKSEFDWLNPDDIESINVLKGKAAEKKYGEKGKDGIVEIITKKE
ncbi:M56 family metallopeptidase [Hyunsoonleella aestuarii]|uniref:Peptidase M56 domain-containing protein n=1 Tax=Hyunsoonleella aestuarii TaxID=912802 RepID=A0ABP8EC84_9FLAO|nr:M56 family metallopeptidase [Hyunsoonleella aestuarii]